MRQVLPGDIDMAVRALLALPRDLRADGADLLLAAAQLADRLYRPGKGVHPLFGGGTLMDAAGRWPLLDGAPADHPDYLETLALLTDRLSRGYNRGSAGSPDRPPAG